MIAVPGKAEANQPERGAPVPFAAEYHFFEVLWRLPPEREILSSR
jgi:hypothetical protein